jgi:hypothetical protein
MLIAEKLNRQQLDEFENMENEENIEAGEMLPLIPEREYRVQCIAVEKDIFNFGSLKFFLKFIIMPPSKYEGTKIFMAMNQYKKVPPGSKYYEQWVIANGNIKPVRKDRMSPAIFKNLCFEAVVRTVKPKFKDGSEKPDCFHYSVIDYLKKRIL